MLNPYQSLDEEDLEGNGEGSPTLLSNMQITASIELPPCNQKSRSEDCSID